MLSFGLKLYFDPSLANNITSNISTELPPTPDEPVLFSSGYFTFTLDWRSYSETKYNASPVVYVLEVTRHENITDPFIIMPLIQKYHMVIFFFISYFTDMLINKSLSCWIHMPEIEAKYGNYVTF